MCDREGSGGVIARDHHHADSGRKGDAYGVWHFRTWWIPEQGEPEQ